MEILVKDVSRDQLDGAQCIVHSRRVGAVVITYPTDSYLLSIVLCRECEDKLFLKWLSAYVRRRNDERESS